MNQNLTERFLKYFSYNQLVLLLASTLFYFLGAGVARYLGENIDWISLFFGLGYVFLLLISSFVLQIYFNPFKSAVSKKHQSPIEKTILLDMVFLLVGLTTMAIGWVLAYLLLVGQSTFSAASVFLILIFVLAFINAVPPFNLSVRGYGELVLVIMIADLVPGLAYSIQTGTMHSLVLLLAFPLTPLLLAMMISTSLKDYLKEMISGEKTLVIMVGWRLAMYMHDWLILAAYLLVGIASLIGLPWNLVWPMLLIAPISIFTVYEILRIKSGIKPRWNLLSLSGYAGIGCMLYVLLFTLWIK